MRCSPRHLTTAIILMMVLAILGCGEQSPVQSRSDNPPDTHAQSVPLGATAPAAGAGAADPGELDGQVLAGRRGRSFEIEERMRRGLGRQFLCMTAPTGSSERVVVVTGQRAAASAQQSLTKVPDGPETSTVVVGDAQDRRRSVWTLVPIWDRLEAAQPDSEAPGSMAEVDLPQGRGQTCPRLVIHLAPRDQVDPVMQDWAERAIQRYGVDRILVRYGLTATAASG